MKSRLAKCTTTLQLQIVMCVNPTFAEALQDSDFISNNCLKPMFKVVKQALGEMVRSGLTPTNSESEMETLVQTKFGERLVHSVMSKTGFIVLIM